MDATPVVQSSIVFEGSSVDDFETTVTVTDPTADRTITIPDETGTLVTTGSTGVVTSTMLASGTITGGDIADDSIGESKMADDAIGQDQLKSVVNLQVLNSSRCIKIYIWCWCITTLDFLSQYKYNRIYYGSKITLKER